MNRTRLWLQRSTSVARWRLWLSALSIAIGCVFFFSIILVSTSLGRQTLETLRFALGWYHIAQQQQQLLQTLEVAFQTAIPPVEMHRHSVVIPQRRGQEYWQHQTHTVHVPATTSLDRYEAVLQNIVRQLHHTVIKREKQQHPTQTTISLTVGIIGLPGNTFVLTQPHRAPVVMSTPPPATPSAPDRPRTQVAIVIDDLGWDLQAAQALLALNIPLSFAILPNAPYGSLIAHEAQRRGYDVLLHLPMEPHEYPDVDPGYPVLLSSMQPGQLTEQITTALQALPTVVGVNNHMGSRLTENRRIMETVMRQIKRHHLFFLDSRTTKHSLAYQIAREMGVPTAERHVFLDAEVDRIKIRRQLHHLATRALIQGSAIGIGHPYPETLQVLQQVLPELRQNGTEVVAVSRLVR